MSKTAIRPNHMKIQWHDYVDAQSGRPLSDAPLQERASIVGRTGLLLLSCGTGAWRVRRSMNMLAEKLGLVCTADIGLMSLDYTCFDGGEVFSQSLTLNNTGVNTLKLYKLEQFVQSFSEGDLSVTGEEVHGQLDEIEHIRGQYTPAVLGLAAALACGGFTFLLGGGLPEILFAFIGAGVGNWIRSAMLRRHYTLLLCIGVSVSAACVVYAGCLYAAEVLFHLDAQHQAGYICAMLFIIPGFPFITSGIDMAKLDMRSGLERLTYAIMIVAVSTIVAWLTALLLHLEPVEFMPLGLSEMQLVVLRLVASFCGVFGFSIMFNSTVSMAAIAAVIGMVSNTLRLELVSLAGFPPAAAAFLGALSAGLLASVFKQRCGYPRISITVPSIVIMVPGLYFYRGIYNLGAMDLSMSASWLASAVLLVMALPLGLIFARILTDHRFRYCN